MRIDIVRYEPTIAAELASAYNGMIQPVPHCYPVSGEDFASAMSATVGGEQRHERLGSEVAFVVRNGLTTLGFVHVGIEHPEEPGEIQQGIIRFLGYERGHRQFGQALLDTAEDYFHQHNVAQVTAFLNSYCYPFYHLKYAYLSDRLDQVHALLSFNGYQKKGNELILDWPNFTPVTPSHADVTAEVSLEWKEGLGARPGLVIRAHLGKEEIGTCECVSGGEYSRADEAQDWLFTTWLGVSEQMQGKGLGRHLLQRALQEMHNIGYQHAAISAEGHNARALLFYGNYGYHVVDWTYGLQKTDLN